MYSLHDENIQLISACEKKKFEEAILGYADALQALSKCCGDVSSDCTETSCNFQRTNCDTIFNDCENMDNCENLEEKCQEAEDLYKQLVKNCKKH